MTQRGVLPFIAAVVLTAPLLPMDALGQSGVTERVSVAYNGTEANNGSLSLAVSGDGRYVAFESWASNLVLGDTNNQPDVFVRDRETGTTELMSVASDDTQGDGHSYYPSISADGRYVAFRSSASTFVQGDTNGTWDIFVHDRLSNTTELVSVAWDGGPANNFSTDPSISANGRYVAFTSYAKNLVQGDTNNAADIFVRDRLSNTTERVSVASGGTQGNSFSGGTAISGDGRYVAFYSYASNLVLGDANNLQDIFVRDRQLGTMELVSVASDGTQANNNSFSLSISADGGYVAFISYASNLVPGDTNNLQDIFLRDRQLGTTELVSVASDGTHGNGLSEDPALSADGRYVAFRSLASTLVPGDTNNQADIFVRDRETGTTELVSVSSDGTQTNGSSDSSAISGDARYVVFQSLASNLVPGDTNNAADIFVHQRLALPEVGPIATIIDPVPVWTDVDAVATITYEGYLEDLTASWKWGDGVTSAGNIVDEGSGVFEATGTHRYGTPGVYVVALTVEDDVGGADSETFQYVVVFDPSSGFVTGGGHIDSPAGAYAYDPYVEGRATFGFVSKYLKGANVPTGNTEFHFEAGGLKFRSVAYQWLVVAGAKAQFKGVGIIESIGDGFGFLLKAIDGKQINGIDRFRITIWDADTEDLVYDNEIDAAEDADATTALTGGSIVVHKAK